MRLFLASQTYLKDVEMCDLGMWFSDEPGSPGLMIELDHPKGLFQPK